MVETEWVWPMGRKTGKRLCPFFRGQCTLFREMVARGAGYSVSVTQTVCQLNMCKAIDSVYILRFTKEHDSRLQQVFTVSDTTTTTDNRLLRGPYIEIPKIDLQQAPWLASDHCQRKKPNDFYWQCLVWRFQQTNSKSFLSSMISEQHQCHSQENMFPKSILTCFCQAWVAHFVQWSFNMPLTLKSIKMGHDRSEIFRQRLRSGEEWELVDYTRLTILKTRGNVLGNGDSL